MELYLELPPDFPGALCTQTDSEAFFPEKGGATREAIQICHGCPFEVPCREFAIRTRQEFGVWGGTTHRQRKLTWRRKDREERERRQAVESEELCPAS